MPAEFAFLFIYFFGGKHAARPPWCQLDLANQNTEPVLGEQRDCEARALFVSDNGILGHGLLFFSSLACKTMLAR